MTDSTTGTNGTPQRQARHNGTTGPGTPSPLGARKVYVTGNQPDMQVPMREIVLTPTRTATGGTEPNPSIRLYDTSGPYTDPTFTPDLQQGLHRTGMGDAELAAEREGISGAVIQAGADTLAQRPFVGQRQRRAETGNRRAVGAQQRGIDAVHRGAAHQAEKPGILWQTGAFRN